MACVLFDLLMTNDNIYDEGQSLEERKTETVVRTLQLFRAGSHIYGVFADEIATIVSWREPTPLPQSPKSVLGIVCLQGRMLTVLDLASLFIGGATSSETIPTESVSGEAPAQHLIALRGDEQLAIAVDDVQTTIEIGGNDFDDKQETAGALVVGVLHREGLDIQVLNPKELFSTAIQGRERRRRRF
jgi:chemotaxis signal transduction protein